MGQASSTIDFATALRDPTAFFSEPKRYCRTSPAVAEVEASLLRQWEQIARAYRLPILKGWVSARRTSSDA